jgi:hypothetical protein
MYEQVVMIRHEAVGTDAYIPQFAGFYEEIDKPKIIFMFGKRYFTAAASIHDMIPGAWILDA